MLVAYIFAYGSLVHPADWAQRHLPGRPIYGWLADHYRHWQVGIDNGHRQYDHKHYLDADGVRYPGIIAALGVNQRPGWRINGLALPVSAERLAQIDQREKSYYRSDDLRPWFSAADPRQRAELSAPLFTYYPRIENLRLAAEQAPVIASSYEQYCQQGFVAWGGRDEFMTSTVTPPYQHLELTLYRQEDSGLY